jgi:hypothetical protein
MKNLLILGALAATLSACSKNDSYNQHPLTTPEELKPLVKAPVTTGKDAQKKIKIDTIETAHLAQKADQHMQRLSNYFYTEGGNVQKIFAELNGNGSPQEGSAGKVLMPEVIADGGRLTCINDGLIAVDMDPQNLGKKSNTLLKTENGQSLLHHLIKKMRGSSDEKITTFSSVITDLKGSNGNFLKEKYVVVAYGRHALLKEKLNKTTESKFMCYVAYPTTKQ